MKIPNIDEILFQLKGFNNDDLSSYTVILKESFQQIEPVFTKPKYLDFFWHCATTIPGWIGEVILANADVESQGSKKLLNLWKSTMIGREIEESILFHAKDEAKHSNIFVYLVSIAFPEFKSTEELSAIKKNLTQISHPDLVKDNYSISEYELLDHLIQMNMGEIRTLIHMHFLGPVIFNMTPKENKDNVFNLLQRLAQDEVTHIGYTSKLIEDWCVNKNYDTAKKLYSDRLRDFHKLTISQTEDTIKEFGQNKFPMLLQI